jgi:hypothetical protein
MLSKMKRLQSLKITICLQGRFTMIKGGMFDLE